jgi:hypothetical protein
VIKRSGGVVSGMLILLLMAKMMEERLWYGEMVKCLTRMGTPKTTGIVIRS